MQLVIADLHRRGASRRRRCARPSPLPAASGGREMQPEWLDANRHPAGGRGRRSPAGAGRCTTGALTLVAAPGLAALGPLSSLSVSRDGTRVIAISGVPGVRQAYLGRILTPTGTPVRTAGTVATGWTKIPTDMADVAAVSWSGDLELAVLGPSDGRAGGIGGPARRARRARRRFGSDAAARPFPAEFEALVAMPERPVITTSPGRPPMLEVGTKRWLLNAGRWDVASAGARSVLSLTARRQLAASCGSAAPSSHRRRSAAPRDGSMRRSLGAMQRATDLLLPRRCPCGDALDDDHARPPRAGRVPGLPAIAARAARRWRYVRIRGPRGLPACSAAARLCRRGPAVPDRLQGTRAGVRWRRCSRSRWSRRWAGWSPALGAGGAGAPGAGAGQPSGAALARVRSRGAARAVGAAADAGRDRERVGLESAAVPGAAGGRPGRPSCCCPRAQRRRLAAPCDPGSAASPRRRRRGSCSSTMC